MNFEFTSLLNTFQPDKSKETLENIINAIKFIKPKKYKHKLNINNYLLIETLTKYSNDISIIEINNNLNELAAYLTYYFSVLKPFSCYDVNLKDFNDNNTYSDFVTCYNEIILSYIMKFIFEENNINFSVKDEKYFIISLKYNKLSPNALKLIYDSFN